MNQPYEVTVKLHIRGPFITSSGTDALRGLDQIFARDGQGNLIIHGSHVKGKFREAVQNLQSVGLLTDFHEDTYLGKENEEGVYLPERGRLHVQDFVLENDVTALEKSSLTRVKIETQTGTAEENALVTLENWFNTGTLSIWRGKMTFFTGNDPEAQDIRDNILRGLKWITNFGAIKGNGYGRLEKVTATLQPFEANTVIPQHTERADVLRLYFEFEDDLFVGGVTRKTNYKESQEVIPGAVIKGALARFLSELCRAKTDTTPIDENNAAVKAEFPALAKHFANIHFTYAFPTDVTASGRPVVIPFSTVKDSEGHVWDLANQAARQDVEGEVVLGPDGKALTYQVDWKDFSKLKEMFGWAECQLINTTRTAIESQTRTADEERLYTFQYISPYQATSDKTPQKIRWSAYLRLPSSKSIGESVSVQLWDDLKKALNAGWRYLGKRDARFALTAEPGEPKHHKTKHPDGNLVNNLAIVVLQTDAFLFDGRSIASAPDDDLWEVYRQYWAMATEQQCELINYFARQKMMGGYLGKRYPLAANYYYPYILTEAGSVFVLQAKQPNEARNVLQRLERQGLPLPNDATWQTCPFVPENGYGEICINLNWHWEKTLRV